MCFNISDLQRCLYLVVNPEAGVTNCEGPGLIVQATEGGAHPVLITFSPCLTMF